MHHSGDAEALSMFPVMLGAFAGWWCFVTYVTSRFGWTGLAEVYPAGEPPPTGASTFGRCNGKIGWLTRYKSCLKVTPMTAGIYVVPSWIFRLFHAPLLLPWSGVRSVTEKRLLFFRRLVIRFEDQERRKLTLFLPWRALPTIRETSGRRDVDPPRREGSWGGW